MIWYDTCEALHRANYERIGEGIANLFKVLGMTPHLASPERASHVQWFESIEKRANRMHADACEAGYGAGFDDLMWQASVCAESGAYNCDCDVIVEGCGSPIPMGALNKALYTCEYVRGMVDSEDDE